jgi:hypothetical protein
MNLTRLALSQDDLWYSETKLSVNPKWTAHTARAPSEEEKERLRQMIEDARFSTTAVMDNFDARLGLYLPPTGYAAVWNAQSLFVADVFDRNAFRGLAGVTITRKKAPTNLNEAFFRLNALVGDRSPAPDARAPPDPEGPWVCSLGPFAWMGLYTSNAARSGMTAMVVSGLDDAVWETLSAEMRKWHRVLTVGEVFLKLRPWREYAAANRRRLLAAMVRALGESLAESRWLELPQSRYAARGSKVECDAWFGKAELRVPEWFVFPSKLPRHCPPHGCEPGQGIRTDLRETYVFEVKPEFDVVMDDLRELREKEYARLAGCCSTKDEYSARVYGPLDDVYVTKQAGAPKPETHDASAAQARQELGGVFGSIRERDPEAEDMVTWEDADLTTNRMIESSFQFRARGEEDAPAESGVVRYTAWMVRASCVDSTGRAEPEGKIQTRRLAALALDDYEPMQR